MYFARKLVKNHFLVIFDFECSFFFFQEARENLKPLQVSHDVVNPVVRFYL